MAGGRAQAAEGFAAGQVAAGVQGLGVAGAQGGQADELEPQKVGLLRAGKQHAQVHQPGGTVHRAQGEAAPAGKARPRGDQQLPGQPRAVDSGGHRAAAAQVIKG
eukprot:scaffold648034_cov45-Prasinocladus_malaysianus.AAC.2